jgi:hypothetical protein
LLLSSACATVPPCAPVAPVTKTTGFLFMALFLFKQSYSPVNRIEMEG